MKRILTCLTMLLLLLSMAEAQTVSQYEYWTDDNYADRTMEEATGSEVTLSVSTEQLAAGIHFLNFRALRDDGIWGNYCRYLYYIPTLSSTSTGSLSVEYWLDDNRAGLSNENVDGNQLSLVIDISQLTPGVHFFNCTPIDSENGRGNSERYLFYVPQPLDETTVAALAGYEYWLDDNYQAKTVSHDDEAQQVLAISIDGLSSGVHYFNCRAVNECGAYGNPIRKMFYIPSTQPINDATLAAAEYWIDDDYASKVSIENSNVTQTFAIDIDALSSGVHYFNYRVIDSEGHYSNPIRELFYIAGAAQSEIAELLEYEYWLDDNTAEKVTGKSTTSEYQFTIDVSKLEDGNHTFNFKAKNVLEQEVTFTETFDWENNEVYVEPAKSVITFTSTKALDFSTPINGLKAYVVTEVVGTKAILKEVKTKVPAGTGLILMGTIGTTYTIPCTTDIPEAIVNKLIGVTTDTTIGSDDLDYIMKDGRFVKAGVGTISAGKAYLRLDSPLSRSIDCVFGGDATGIDTIYEGNDIDKVYNLNGQRMEHPTKGVNIINGKKVIRR